MAYTVTLPLPPNLANGRMHWRTKDRKQGLYRTEALVWLVWGVNAGRVRPRRPLTRASLSATLYVFSRMDYDNLVGRLKWTVDFLVQDGWIVDDSPAVLEEPWLVQQEIDRKWPRVVVTLEPVA